MKKYLEPVDAIARARALDPQQSFIVQAPAGSGKTELLIQRYLRLLTTVLEPEQVIAITFTRKAAAEMQSRVLAAMRDAERGEPPESKHRSTTLELARAVLERDRARDWNVRAFPQRLRIGTLDALNVMLARQMPILSGGVAASNVTEDATRAYREAAKRAIDGLLNSMQGRDALRAVLREHDNDLARLERMIAELLATREQWLPALARQSAAIRAETEAGWKALADAKLRQLLAGFPGRLLPQLTSLMRHVAANAQSPALRSRLSSWTEPPADVELLRCSIEPWRAVASLLLTGSGTWRKKITKREGFGPEHASLRRDLMQLLGQLENDEEARVALADIATLPAAAMADEEAELLSALRQLLLNAVAELRVGFSIGRTVDFVELAASARQALGSSDEPSELLLALDQRIHHILVDEFQDTSQAQIELLELLTAGWQEGDGRSLFLVGDPMQSIYRFRHADMSLFLRTKAFGIGQLRFESLVLSANFRSAPAVVSWVNETFTDVFPAQDDLELGVTQFHACETTRQPQERQYVRCHPLDSDDLDRELCTVVELIREERKRTRDSSIGILVQSRTHLVGLRSKLRQLPWPVRAVEIDALNTEPFAQDLLALCRALCHLADKPAWLAVLRAPWCGLTWTDLERLVAGHGSRTVWELMSDDNTLARLSDGGRERLLRTRAVLAGALENRALYSLAEWVRRVWVGLLGPETLTRLDQREKAEQFFALLEQLGTSGHADDPVSLEAAFARPIPEADPESSAGIDIMTIHRAKGLEFDTVILSGLNRAPREDQPRALRIIERTTEDGTTHRLTAPEMQGPSAAASYIRTLESRRDHAERGRLLYVAATRARERLHLVWGVRSAHAKPAPRSLLANIWPRVRSLEPGSLSGPVEVAEHSSRWLEPRLRRLSTKYLCERPIIATTNADPVEAEAPPRVEYTWAGESSLQVGIVVHRYLQTIAETVVSSWNSEKVESLRDVFRAELELLGVDVGELDSAADRVSEALVQVLADPVGRWLLAAHEEAGSELEIASLSEAHLSHMRLDRTFVDDDGVRWIVDFKTGTHGGGRLDEFLDSEVERYRPQLERYARAMARTEAREIRVGLYYPLLRAFRNWSPDLSQHDPEMRPDSA